MISVSVIAWALKKELGSFFSTEAHKDWDLTRYINSAARAITIWRNFDFNNYDYEIVVTEWITSYDIPYQISTYFILDENWDEVDFLNFTDYYRTKDKTEVIWIWAEKLKCTKPWTYTIFYRGFPPTITSLSWNLDIPEHFYDLILLKSTYFGFMDIQAYDKANKKENIFTWMISDLAKRSSDPQPTKTKRLNKSPNGSTVW